MKLTTLFTWTIWAWLITWWMYLAKWEEKHEIVNLVTNRTRQGTEYITSWSWIMTTIWNLNNTINVPTDDRKIDPITSFLNQNPNLRQRIQGTSWYRDFLVWKLPTDVVEKYIYDAYSIEQVLLQYPSILQKIQYEIWWEKYIRGDTNPSDMLAGNIQSFIILQKIEQEQPEFFNLAQKSPLWNSWIQYGEDYIVVGQNEILTSLKLRLEFLDTNPWIEKKLQEKGYTRNNFFTDNWSKWEGIYWAIDELKEADGVNH